MYYILPVLYTINKYKFVIVCAQGPRAKGLTADGQFKLLSIVNSYCWSFNLQGRICVSVRVVAHAHAQTTGTGTGNLLLYMGIILEN